MSLEAIEGAVFVVALDVVDYNYDLVRVDLCVVVLLLSPFCLIFLFFIDGCFLSFVENELQLKDGPK